MTDTITIQKPSTKKIQGEITLNGSKSISNRLLIINAICGNINFSNLSNADDTVFLQNILKSNDSILDAGAGGTTFRFLTAFLAIQDGREAILTGSERMQQRPIKVLVDALQQLGADISYEKNKDYPPLKIKGKKLRGGKITLPADISSQYITALLLIAPTLEQGLEIQLKGTIVSIPYIEMTLKMMEYFGIKTDFSIEQKYIKVEHGNYVPKDFFVESDWSAASYFYSIAILAEDADITLHGLTAQQIQGDAVIAKIANDFGIQSTFADNAVRLQKTATPKNEYYKYDFLRCPDLAQTVVSFCAGLCVDATFHGLQTLRIKETDRIQALDNELFNLGLSNLEEIDSNTWELQNCMPQVYNDYDIKTYEDHRMAMSFAPLSIVTNQIKIEERNVVSKSYPNFWNDLEKLGFKIINI
ncbi:MAG: 3-phosphoshikimate 1-carboxyvinyltransferase [Sphingobacteriales bacterium]|nr:MAG: 3-phosphoshikimate 1-carboxyvinyltransferase [Sphingobacteriales bacterium]